jgi:RNA polymerase sigma factor (sigma-70 family)
MADEQHDFDQLMQQLREGSPEAAEYLFRHYRTDLVRVIRHNLNKRLRKQFDSVDFLQSVWRTFFTLPIEQLEFADSRALRAFLVELAANKVIDTYRSRFQSRRRSLNREKSLEGSAAIAASYLAADDPTPSQIAIEDEVWDQLITGLPKVGQSILRMLREGRSQREIAQELSVTERSIHRLLQKLQSKGQP